jgi:hypothetical protein
VLASKGFHEYSHSQKVTMPGPANPLLKMTSPLE